MVLALLFRARAYSFIQAEANFLACGQVREAAVMAAQAIVQLKGTVVTCTKRKNIDI